MHCSATLPSVLTHDRLQQMLLLPPTSSPSTPSPFRAREERLKAHINYWGSHRLTGSRHFITSTRSTLHLQATKCLPNRKLGLCCRRWKASINCDALLKASWKHSRQQQHRFLFNKERVFWVKTSVSSQEGEQTTGWQAWGSEQWSLPTWSDSKITQMSQYHHKHVQALPMQPSASGKWV